MNGDLQGDTPSGSTGLPFVLHTYAPVYSVEMVNVEEHAFVVVVGDS